MSTEDERWARHIAFLESEKSKKIAAAITAGYEGAYVSYDGEIGMLNLAITNAKVEQYVAKHGRPPHWAMGGDQVMLDDMTDDEDDDESGVVGGISPYRDHYHIFTDHWDEYVEGNEPDALALAHTIFDEMVQETGKARLYFVSEKDDREEGDGDCLRSVGDWPR